MCCCHLLLCAGIPVVLRSKFSASQFWDDCRKYNVTVIQYIGEIMRYLCNTPQVCANTASTLILLSHTERFRKLTNACSSFLFKQKLSDKNHKVRLAVGNGIRADVWRDFVRRFGEIQIREFYGATEGNFALLNYSSKMGALGRHTFLHKVKVHVSAHIKK